MRPIKKTFYWLTSQLLELLLSFVLVSFVQKSLNVGLFPPLLSRLIITRLPLFIFVRNRLILVFF